MATKTIKITDDRQGNTYRTGVNGRMFDLPLNEEFEVDEALVEHLEGIGCRFEEVEAKRAGSSKEGSVEGSARELSRNEADMAGTRNKTLNQSANAGDQPGDLTAAGGGGPGSGTDGGVLGKNVAADAKVSDIRVAAERATAHDAPAAEIAGEGESGAPKAKPQTGGPSHKATAEEKAADKAKK